MIQKDRDFIMQKFRAGSIRILITTDVLGRGIDVQQVSLVINYDLPQARETYVHRIGRSGRWGRKGLAISLCLDEVDIFLPYLLIEVFSRLKIRSIVLQTLEKYSVIILATQSNEIRAFSYFEFFPSSRYC